MGDAKARLGTYMAVAAANLVVSVLPTLLGVEYGWIYSCLCDVQDSKVLRTILRSAVPHQDVLRVGHC